jgi:hypothetical protein
MASLATCIQKAGDLFPAEDRKAIMLSAQELRRQGMGSREAELAAVARQADALGLTVAEAEGRLAAGKVTEAIPKEEAPAEQPRPAAAAELDAVAQQFPDLAVQMDGMDKPLPLAEFMKAVQAEADELAADAPLVQLAAQCALTNGV